MLFEEIRNVIHKEGREYILAVDIDHIIKEGRKVCFSFSKIGTKFISVHLPNKKCINYIISEDFLIPIPQSGEKITIHKERKTLPILSEVYPYNTNLNLWHREPEREGIYKVKYIEYKSHWSSSDYPTIRLESEDSSLSDYPTIRLESEDSSLIAIEMIHSFIIGDYSYIIKANQELLGEEYKGSMNLICGEKRWKTPTGIVIPKILMILNGEEK